MRSGGSEGGQTYTQDQAHLHQRRQLPHSAVLVLARPPSPQHARLLVGREVERLEGHAVGAEDGLEAGGGGDDVCGAGGEGGVDVEGRVGAVGLGGFGGVGCRCHGSGVG